MKSFNLFGESWAADSEKSEPKPTENKTNKQPKKAAKKNAAKSASQKSSSAYRTISEVAEGMGIATHVLR